MGHVKGSEPSPVWSFTYKLPKGAAPWGPHPTRQKGPRGSKGWKEL